MQLRTRAGSTHRARVGQVLDVAAVLLVWLVLVMPTRPDQLTAPALVRVPLEGIAILLLALAVPRPFRSVATAVVGLGVGVVALLTIFDVGFFQVLDRPFVAVTDGYQLQAGLDFVNQSAGPVAAVGAVVAAALAGVMVVLLSWVSVARMGRLARRHRRRSTWAAAALVATWAIAALAGLDAVPHVSVASADAGGRVAREMRSSSAALAGQRRFDALVAADHFRQPGAANLDALRGRNVLLVFVESYGRVAVQGSGAHGVQSLLDASTRQLEAAGYSSRSAFLTSPTFGGSSWLAHSTLQSGVWVDNQWAYDRLLSGPRLSLSRAFGQAGWRTIAVLPSDRRDWPAGKAYYGFDATYDSSNLGYAGPRFGFSSMPDQYALWSFWRTETRRGSGPVMAEVDLASSHGPWAPLPGMVSWASLGDGSVFAPIHDRAQSAKDLWSNRDAVPAAYMRSIEYSMTALVSFVTTYGDDNLVVVLLGDHQPATIVSGYGGGRDVPITVVTRDRGVMARTSGWGWQHGMRPDQAAPVWRMDTFRDRFLAAFSDPRQPSAPALAAAKRP